MKASVLPHVVPHIRCREEMICNIPGHLEFVADALLLMKNHLKGLGMPLELWKDFEIAIAEGLNNAIQYGCKNQIDEAIELRWSWNGEWLNIQIKDPSQYLPKLPYGQLPQDPLYESGRGHFLMHQLMDHVEHRLEENHHTLYLVKQVQRPTLSNQSLEEMNAIVDSMTQELTECYEVVSALFRFCGLFASSASFNDLLRSALDQLCTIIQADSAFLRLVKDQSLTHIHTTGSIEIPAQISMDSDITEVNVFKNGVDVSVENTRILPAHDPLSKLEGSLIISPILRQDKIVGTLVIHRKSVSEYFSASQVRLIKAISEFLGIAQANAELMEEKESQRRTMQELEIAAEIQRSLSPKTFPKIPGYNFYGFTQPALQVGGDYFDLIHIPEKNGVLLVIADVVGKSLPAALLATILRTAVHSRTTLSSQPEELIRQINLQLFDDLSKLEMFITMQAVFLDTKSNTLSLACAGHCPLLLQQFPTQEIISCNAFGFPLGVKADSVYEKYSLNLKEGARGILITDGVYEGTSPAGEMLGMPAILNYFSSFQQMNAEKLCHQMFEQINLFYGSQPPSDDISLIAFEHSGNLL